MIRTYFNQRAEVWDEVSSEKDATKLEWMVQRLDIEYGSTVLDVGSGTGVFVPFLLSRIGRSGRLMALDFAEEMLRKNRDKGFEGDVGYLHANIASVPLLGSVCDAVVCYSSFPHFQDKLRALSEISRVLKNGGRLFICHTSSRDKINHIHSQIPAVANDTIPNGDEVRLLLLMAGFTDIRIDDSSGSYLASARKPK